MATAIADKTTKLKIIMNKLVGKIVINGNIITETGLHIGGSKTVMEIGGVDNNVVKNGNGKPYIPGSSLKGKLRSLLAKKEGSVDFFRSRDVKKGEKHDGELYIGDLFGSPANNDETQKYARLFVRDAKMDIQKLEALKAEAKLYEMEFDYSDVKWENVIDRKKGTAKGGGLRQMERVPAGAVFSFEIVYDLYSDYKKEDESKLLTPTRLEKHLSSLSEAMQLLQDDYLGGQGSRGYGKVKFDIGKSDVKLKLIDDGYNEVIVEDELQEGDKFKFIKEQFIVFRSRLVALNSNAV